MNWKIAVLVLMSWGGLAMAADPVKTEAAPVAAAEESRLSPAQRAKSKKMRCVKEQVTGSRFAKRICHTEEEWARIQESGVEAVKNIQNKPIPLQAG